MKTSGITGGIERFSAQEIFGKILKVSHFYLGFSPDNFFFFKFSRVL